MPTHWMDDRKLVLTSENRERLGSDYQAAYTVPCKRLRSGRVVPLHTCAVCKGSGNDPDNVYDNCIVCGGSGGRAAPPTN